MSDSVKFKDKYSHNEDFVKYVRAACEFPDWEIIGVFYSALHYMNLYLNKRYNADVADIDSHAKRNEYIKRNCSVNIARAYKTLYDLSREARYQFTDVSSKTKYVNQKYKELKALCQSDMLVVMS